MRIGKIKGTATFGENHTFTGTDVYAEYLNKKGYVSELTFHYDFYTNNLHGLVTKVLDAYLNDKPTPDNVSNVRSA
jgi:hypothetical protein